MRSTLSAFVFAGLLTAVSPLLADEHDLEVITVGTDKFLRWHGQADRTYFIQVSDPNDHLRKWTWAPIIETGNDEEISYEVDGTADKGFFRLWFSDQFTNDPDGDDFDYDGLSNWDEVTIHQTNPLKWDSDDDGLPDWWEIEHGLDPNDDGSIDPANGANGDPDGDGLTNEFEYWYYADPNLADTDGDGLNDFDEVFVYGTWPDAADSDGDGLNDYDEIFTHGTDPWSWDTDGDTLSDGDEVLIHGTNPLDTDTDGDWMWDDYEIANSLDPTDAADGLLDADGDGLANQLEFVFMDQGYDPFVVNNAAAFPWLEDPDWDGMTTQVEFTVHLTNPRQPDTDGDGMGDGWEIAHGFNAKLNNRNGGPANHHPDADPDGDGLTNAEEEQHGTNPFAADSDGDGVSDGDEVDQGSNPNDPNDSQPPPNGTVPANVTFGDPSGSHSEKYRVQLTPLEGDTGGVRFRTNRQYGVPQTDTFRLPKGAKYKVELIHVGTDPKYRDDPRPDYDYQLEIDDDANCLVVDDPQYIMGFNYDSDIFFASGKDATLYVPLFKPKEVSFSASTIGNLTSDDTSVTYDAPHWQDSNDDGDADDPGERKYPIAYVRNTPPTIAGKIAVKPSGLTAVSGFSAKIKVTGPGNIEIDETAATIGTDEIELPATASTGNFVNEIDYLNPMTLSWEVEVNDKGHWCEAGDTGHRTYVTLGAPATTMRQETLFDIGSRNADGETVAADATAKIWGEFTDRIVRKVDTSSGLPNGAQLSYYEDYECSNISSAALLEFEDGQCGSWARLFLDILKAQSIDQPGDFVVFRQINSYGVPDADLGFLVKNWNFSATGNSGNAQFEFLGIPDSPFITATSYNWLYSEVSDQAGTPGQKTANPASLFNNHQVALIGGNYYDPSYGVKYTSLNQIDTNAISGYFLVDDTLAVDESVVGVDLNSDGDATDIGVIVFSILSRINPATPDLHEDIFDY